MLGGNALKILNAKPIEKGIPQLSSIPFRSEIIAFQKSTHTPIEKWRKNK